MPELQAVAKIKNEVEPDPARHPRYYFEDGTIILIVEGIIFRLYGGLIGRWSEVMKAKIDRAMSNMENQEKLDGVPSLVIPDSAEGFTAVLDFAFALDTPPCPSSDFDVIISALEIAKKYKFDYAFQTAAWHLRKMFPTSLEDFKAEPGLITFTGSRAAHVIQAAIDFDLPDLLPFAFYAIATYPWRTHDPRSAHPVFSLLSPEDLNRVVSGMGHIQEEALKMAFRMHEHGLLKTECSSRVSLHATCARGKPDLIWVDHSAALNDFLRNPMCQLAIRRRCQFHTLCRFCASAIQEKMAAELAMFYDKLPEIFQLWVTGLPPSLILC